MNFQKVFFRDLVYYPIAFLQAGNIRSHEAILGESQFADRTELELIQVGRLRQLLEHARIHVPFYCDLAGHSGQPNLDELPFLYKSDLQQSNAQLKSTAALGRLALKTTGGSTGEPVTLTKTRAALAWELAATWRGYSWAGVGVGDRQARFWGTPQDRSNRRKAMLIDFVCNRVRFSAFHFCEEDLRKYAKQLVRIRPRYLYGYVSMLVEFAKFLLHENIKLDLSLKCIITTSEVLSDIDRQLLEETFSTRVYNEYGCGELGTVAHECEEGSLHLSEENMIVEILDGDRRCNTGEVGELVVTELNNLSFPLIRYRTGDFGAVTNRTCSCGRTLQVLESIQGRAYDFIRNRQGMSFHGEFIMYIFEDLRKSGHNIRQFQVIQQDYDSFLVRIVTDPSYDSSCENVIAQRIREHVDMKSHVGFEYVERIEREKSGKLRLIKGLD